MKRRVIAAMMIGAAVLMMGCAGNADQGTEATTESQAESKETEASSEEAKETPQRPDYRALDYVTLESIRGLR